MVYADIQQITRPLTFKDFSSGPWRVKIQDKEVVQSERQLIG